MTKEEIINRMMEAAKEDRERFFRVADSMIFQPKFADRLTEIEAEKQRWRDMSDIEGYPDIDWPLALPDWWVETKFASSWKAGYLDERSDSSARQSSDLSR